MRPIRERRAGLERRPRLVERIIRGGIHRMRVIGRSTMEQVRHAMGLDYFRD